MANANRPFGMRPVRNLSASPYNAMVSNYHVPASNGVAMYLGDPMILTGTGNTAAFMGYPAGTLADVGLTTIPAAGIPATSYTNFLLGSLISIIPVTRESTIYRAANVEMIVEVMDDPFTVYQIQDNGAVAAGLGVGSIGLNANLIAGTGSNSSGQSGFMLDAGSVNAPSTAIGLQLTILRVSNLQQAGGNDPNSPFCVWDVIINQHPFSAPAVGI